METIGIICEYNPFHNGHKRQIDILREKFPEALIVAIMSGNFVQRGEPAVFDKYLRARAAVSCGADLCVGIPFNFSVLSAEGFARAGVSIAHKLGLDAISFGVECENVSELETLADFLLDSDYEQKVLNKCKLSPELSLMKAGESVIEEKLGREYARLITEPNNILALEYIKAIKKDSLSLSTIPILREGEGYKSLSPSHLPSATFVREQIFSSKDFAQCVPSKALEIYTRAIDEGEVFNNDAFSSFVLSFLSLQDEKKLDFSLGSAELSNRIKNATKNATSTQELISNCVTSRYTRSRIRRGIISCLFGIEHNEFMHKSPEFVQLLAANGSGCELLSRLRGSSFPVVTKSADYLTLSDSAEFKRQFEFEMRACGLWGQFQKKPSPYSAFMKKSPVILGGE